MIAAAVLSGAKTGGKRLSELPAQSVSAGLRRRIR